MPLSNCSVNDVLVQATPLLDESLFWVVDVANPAVVDALLEHAPHPIVHKTQNVRFRRNIALRLKKVCYKVSLCENCQQNFGHNYPCKNYWWGRPPSAWKFGACWPTRFQNADFWSIFARSASPLAKKVQLTLIESPLLAFERALDEHCTLSLSPKRGSKTQGVQNLNNKLW